MPFLQLPSLPSLPDLGRRRRSFSRLRSFHLNTTPPSSPGPFSPEPLSPTETLVSSSSSETEDLPVKEEVKAPTRTQKKKQVSRALSLALQRVAPEGVPAVFWLGIAVLVSLLFVLSLVCTFRGAKAAPPFFKPILDEVAATNPGIVLLGENVDIDVEEPSITIRWSILACGENYILPGSTGVHGSSACGLPMTPLYIFVDGDTEPTTTYSPSIIPFNRKNGERRNIQNLVQFDSDHVLDVHEDYLYPFDTYKLSSTIRITTLANESIPIAKLATIDTTSSFVVDTADIESYNNLSSTGPEIPSRDIDMRVKRPAEARTYTLILFALGWFFTHISVGHVVMSRKTADVKIILKNLVLSGMILAGIPQLRNSMPDAPGLDGVLIDSIGYFPQMVITGLCVVILLLVLFARELDASSASRPLLPSPPSTPIRWSKRPSYLPTFQSISFKARPPPIPSPDSTRTEFAAYDKYRLMKHLQGEYVFPPVRSPFNDPPSPGRGKANAHRRLKTAALPSMAERSEF